VACQDAREFRPAAIPRRIAAEIPDVE
jgi:hypothetical protein